MREPKCCVYVHRSRADRARYYTGVTGNWRARLEAQATEGRAEVKQEKVVFIFNFLDELRRVALATKH